MMIRPLSVEKQRPIMLLNIRAKWATMILKLGIDDYLRATIPMAQRGFVPGRSMYAVLISGAQRGFHLLRPLKITRSIDGMEQRDAAHVHRPGLTPSDGRDQG